MTDQEFAKLATDLATLPSRDRVAHMLEHVRHELDMARSVREWDSVSGLSAMLGRHTDALAGAVAAPEPRKGK
jgi:hypothetical protein